MTQKYEREIEEILRNLHEFVPEESLPERAVKRARSWRDRVPAFGSVRRYFTVQWIMVASIALVMVAFLLRMVSPRFASYLNILGLALFVVAIVMAVAHFGPSRRDTVWRGRVIDISSRDGSWWQSLQRRWWLWWRRRRRRL